MEEVISRTLNQIKQDNIKPIACWRLEIHNYVFWSAFALMVVISGLSFLFIIHLTTEMDWEVFSLVSKNKLRLVTEILPYFWLLLLAVFLYLSFVNFRFTRKGYRYSNRRLAAIVVGLSVGTGTLAYAFRADEKLDTAFKQSIPQYTLVSNSNERMWSKPEMGLLGGEIAGIQEQGLELRDFTGHMWLVLADEHTMVSPAVVIKPKSRIKVFGQQEKESVFLAREIRPWDTIQVKQFIQFRQHIERIQIQTKQPNQQ